MLVGMYSMPGKTWLDLARGVTKAGRQAAFMRLRTAAAKNLASCNVRF